LRNEILARNRKQLTENRYLTQDKSKSKKRNGKGK
jgi:hypothetical protein